MQDQEANTQDRLQLFGTWRFFRDGAPISLCLRQQRLVAAVAILGPSNRNFLAGMLWPETTDSRSMSSLRVSVCLVSKKIPGMLVCDGTTLSLHEKVIVDLHRTWQLINHVLGADSGEASDRDVSELQKGELLPGWYEDFVVEEQNLLRANKLQCFTRIARRALEHGQHDVAVLASRAALALGPYDDEALIILLHAEQRLGNFSGARKIYQEYADKIRADLGIAPTAAMTALVIDTHPPYAI